MLSTPVPARAITRKLGPRVSRSAVTRVSLRTMSACAPASARSSSSRGLPAQLDLDLRCLREQDRKSTRLNSSHGYISYAVFCLKKKKKTTRARRHNYLHARHHDVVH